MFAVFAISLIKLLSYSRFTCIHLTSPFFLLKVFSGMSLGDLETFITEQEKGTIISEPERVDSPVVREYGGNLLDSLSEMHSQESGKNEKQ